MNCIISFASPLDFRNGLREIYVDAPVINQHIVHFEISIFARFLLFEFDEGILHRISADFVSNNFTGFDFTEATENDLQIVVGGYWIQLAYEKDVLWRRDVGVRNISDNLQNRSSSLGLPVLQHLVNFSFGFSVSVVDVLISSDSPVLETICRR